jgi:hypothetical protein
MGMNDKIKKKEKPMQLHYNVDYELDGQTKTQINIWSSDPGSAMAECLKKNPGARIISAWVEGFKGAGFQEWFAPKVQRDPMPEPRRARALRKNERGCEFPFYDEVQSVRQ